VDGVPATARFFRITLPLLRPSIFLCIVVGILNSFTSFDLVYVMTNGGPGHATELLITHIYKAGFRQTRFDYAAAATVGPVLLLVVTVVAKRLAGGTAGSLERGPSPRKGPLFAGGAPLQWRVFWSADLQVRIMIMSGPGGPRSGKSMTRHWSGAPPAGACSR